MNFRSQFLRLFVAFLVLATTIPLLAAGKRRAVQAPSQAPAQTMTLRGVVLDADSAAPVAFAQVVSGDQRTEADAAGKFEIQVGQGRPTSIDVTRSGYTGVTQAIAGGSNDVTVRLKGLPGVTLRMATGQSYELDLDTAQFAYLVPFSSYARADAAKLCKPDGSSFRPDKSIIKRIVGPATSVTFSPCCDKGPTLKIAVELKDGTKTDAYFVDSCFGYEVNFVGRDHITGNYLYLKFDDIAEIVFP